jgi:hypothetical protein
VEQIVVKLNDTKYGEYIEAEVIVDYGSTFLKSLPFMISKEHQVKTFPKREDFLAYVGRMGKAMIAQLGDARFPLPAAQVGGE